MLNLCLTHDPGDSLSLSDVKRECTDIKTSTSSSNSPSDGNNDLKKSWRVFASHSFINCAPQMTCPFSMSHTRAPCRGTLLSSGPPSKMTSFINGPFGILAGLPFLDPDLLYERPLELFELKLYESLKRGLVAEFVFVLPC